MIQILGALRKRVPSGILSEPFYFWIFQNGEPSDYQLVLKCWVNILYHINGDVPCFFKIVVKVVTVHF